MTTHLKTVSEVVAALGGTNRAAALARLGPSAVSMWKANQRIPPEYYLAHKAALDAAGYAAPLSIWGMHEPCLPATQSAPLQGAAQ